MTGSGAALIVLAKAPRAGRVKTRLCPPCTPETAAALAEAALIDTLTIAVATPAARHVLVLDGPPGSWLPPGFDVVPQCDGDLGRRLHAAFCSVAGPAVLVGMDTPQVTSGLLAGALAALGDEGTDAVLGLADDGGYWAIGLNDPTAPVFDGVPMSTDSTGRRQLAALRRRGLRVALLDRLRDIDRYADAAAVARAYPRTRFATAFATFDPQPVFV